MKMNTMKQSTKMHNFRFLYCLRTGRFLLSLLVPSLIVIRIFAHTECFTTCGHYCRGWFPRSLWSESSYIHVYDFGRLPALWLLET